MKDRFEVIYKEVHSAGLEKRIIFAVKVEESIIFISQN